MSERISGIGMTSQRTRMRMIERLREQGIVNEAVLNVMNEIPRHIFVEDALASRAYEDFALAAGVRTNHFAALYRRAHDGIADGGQTARQGA